MLGAAHVAALLAVGKISKTTIPLWVSPRGEGNTLPAFTFMGGPGESIDHLDPVNKHPQNGPGVGYFNSWALSVPDDVFENAMGGTKFRAMPSKILDGYGSTSKQEDVPVLQFGDETMTASITPQWGGKVWSLKQTKNGKDLIFSNPIHQLIIDQTLGGNVDGGIEWNFTENTADERASEVDAEVDDADAVQRRLLVQW